MAKRAMVMLIPGLRMVGISKSLAKKADLGQLKIQNWDGTKQTEYTYGMDLCPPDG